MALKLKQRGYAVRGGCAELVPARRNWRQMRSPPGPPLIPAGKLRNCSGLDEREKRRGEESKNAVICYGQQCHISSWHLKSGSALSSVFQELLRAKIASGLSEADPS